MSSANFPCQKFEVANQDILEVGDCEIRRGMLGIRSMESFYGDTEESSEDIPGRKKSKLKFLKTRLFGRSKRAGGEGNAKLSQSASDITAGKQLGSEEDLACSQGMMGSRALSHDSIFLADQVLTDAEPARVLSQENVHSKIKALQMKLQQQKLHLGPPPLVLPIRRPEDLESRSEDDSLPHSPPEISGGDITTQGALSKTVSQPFSRPLSPIPKPAPTKSVPPPASHPLPLSVTSNSSSSVVEPPSDFSSPAQVTACLDTSAARHRMSVKPRNQRASTKKRLAVTDSSSLLHTLNNTDHPESVIEEEHQLSTQEEVTLETEQAEAVVPVTSQLLTSKSPEVAPIIPEETSKSSGLTFPQQDQALPGRVPSVPSHVLRVKPHRPADAMPSERPHSSFISSELKDKRDGGFEIHLTSDDKRNTPNKAGLTEVSYDQPSTGFASGVVFRGSSVHQQGQNETESTRGILRPTPGSGSFHFSITSAKNRDGERPRSGSFVGVLEQTEARHRMEDKPYSSMKEKAELRDLQPRGGLFAVGRLGQEGALHKSSVLPWERRESLKKVEPSKNVTTDTGAAEGEVVESSKEVVEEAAEAQEVEPDEGKTAFGIKLRSTSQSIRFRSDASSNSNSKPPVCEEQIKHNLSSTCEPHIKPTEVQTTSSNLKETENAPAAPQEPQHAPQTAPQPAPSEVSWMSLAMEKTRSLQQLFTSRFPRDFTGAQTAARPQAQVQTMNQTETQTGAQIQTQTTTQSPLHASAQTEASAQFAQGSVTQSLAQSYLSSGQQQPLWSNRSVKSTASVPTSVSTSGREEKEAAVQEKEAAPLSGRRAVWAGSVSEKAAFLEKRAEWTSPSGTKGVEFKKAQTEAQAPGESPASAKATSQSKDTKPEGRQGVKPAESSPTKVPDRPREDRWLRKNVPSSSSPSSSPPTPSALQSMSESGQPSWMELAKRKSMAWSDKSMD
ncbi:uncharacterized protein cracdla [Symphorus nematophorus]